MATINENDFSFSHLNSRLNWMAAQYFVINGINRVSYQAIPVSCKGCQQRCFDDLMGAPSADPNGLC